MFPIPPNEHLIETRTCKHCGASFPITDKDMEFYSMVSPLFPLVKGGQGDLVSAGKVRIEGDKMRYLIPPSTLCPDCRQQRRLTFRNERKLYKRKCDATGRDIISIYSPDKPYKVYHQDFWWSDKWDPMEYGREFDFSKNFFEQFGELMEEVPKMSLSNINCENCESNDSLRDSKDCYLCFGVNGSENTLFATESGKISNSLDILWSYSISHSYQVNNCNELNSCMFCDDCSSCSNCLFCCKCNGCNYCLFCSHLDNKQYYILNKSYSKEEYLKKLKEFTLTKNYIERGKEVSRDFYKKNPHKMISMYNIENSNGDYIYNTKNVENGFNVVDVNNGKNIYECGRTKDIFDGSSIYDSEGFINNSIAVLHSYNINFSYSINSSNHIVYGMHLVNCTNCFSCIGLRNKQYCILNKQYTREEYETLVPKIIEHMMVPHPTSATRGGESLPLVGGDGGGIEWGEFFPSSLSPFGYNETVAQEYYPMTREEVLGSPTEKATGVKRSSAELRLGGVTQTENHIDSSSVTHPNPPLSRREGAETFLHGPTFNWSDYEAPFPKVEKIIPADKLPDDISKIPDDILNWAIECEVTKKPFRIIKQELEFYRKHHLPIPHKHPDQRHKERMEQRNPRKLFERLCDCPHCEDNWKKIGKYKEDDFALHPKTGKRTKKIITTYSPDRPEIVYCEECYEREVLG